MGKKKEFVGVVISDKMSKTIIVRTLRMAKHPKYGRISKQYKNYKAHDEKNEAKMGDTVRIQETRPLSKDKHFRLLAIVKKTQLAHIGLKEETQ